MTQGQKNPDFESHCFILFLSLFRQFKYLYHFQFNLSVNFNNTAKQLSFKSTSNYEWNLSQIISTFSCRMKHHFNILQFINYYLILLILKYCKNAKYWDKRIAWAHCRPRSDCSLICTGAIWSGSALSAITCQHYCDTSPDCSNFSTSSRVITTIIEFANCVDTDETACNELSHLNLHCLHSSL